MRGRTYRRRHRARARRVGSKRILVGAAILALAVAAGLGIRHIGKAEPLPAATAADAAVSDAPLSEAASDVSRRVYPYSVIPGGAQTVQELESAIENDPVVAAHFAAFDLSKARVETLEKARVAHVSYRTGRDVFWTRKPVVIPAGERVITDGTNMARVRCGNCLSEEPGPVAPDEPPAEVLDTPAPPDEALAPPRGPTGDPEGSVPVDPGAGGPNPGPSSTPGGGVPAGPVEGPTATPGGSAPPGTAGPAGPPDSTGGPSIGGGGTGLSGGSPPTGPPGTAPGPSAGPGGPGSTGPAPPPAPGGSLPPGGGFPTGGSGPPAGPSLPPGHGGNWPPPGASTFPPFGSFSPNLTDGPGGPGDSPGPGGPGNPGFDGPGGPGPGGPGGPGPGGPGGPGPGGPGPGDDPGGDDDPKSVPEPGTTALMLFGAAWIARRRLRGR